MPAGYKIEIAQYQKQTKSKIVKNPDGTVKTIEILTDKDKQPKEIIGHSPKPTPDGQTFFPASMSEKEIFEQAASAFVNPKKGTWKSQHIAKNNQTPLAEAENGLMIRWWQTNDKITSFFPEF